MCVYICVCVCMFTCVHLCRCTYSICLCVAVCVHTCTPWHLCLHDLACLCLCVHVSQYCAMPLTKQVGWMSLCCDSDNTTPHYQLTPAETGGEGESGRDGWGETSGQVEMNSWSYSLTMFFIPLSLPLSSSLFLSLPLSLWTLRDAAKQKHCIVFPTDVLLTHSQGTIYL